MPSVKRALLSRRAVKAYDACFRSTRVVLVPLYCVGLFLRLASFFVPNPAADALAVAAAVCLTPMCFIACLDMRCELIRVLLGSFDFWFLSVTSLLWTLSLGAAIGPTARLAVLPALWMEMVIGILTESFVVLRSGFGVISVSVLGSILTLMLGISLDLTSELDYDEAIMVITPTHFVLSLRDVILNTMGTMAIFYARLMFFSIRGICRRRHDPTNTRVQSNLVRCTLRWEAVTAVNGPKEQQSDNSDRVVSTRAASITSHPRLLQMTPIANPAFEALVTTDTMSSKASAVASQLPRSVRLGLRMVGGIGQLGTVVSLASRSQPPPAHRPARGPPPAVDAPDVVSAVALTATAIYACVFLACCQRKLLRAAATTFNFIFLSAQLSVAHLCVCDVFYWQRHKTVGVVSSWLWIHVLLTADALTPAMKARLGFKVWHLLPVIALAVAGQAALAADLVWTSRWDLQQRVVWSAEVRGGRRVQLHASSLLLGRLATLVVWFLRLLLRVCRRRSDDELILLQGGAEFDYVAWRRLASRDCAPPPAVP